MEAWHWVTVLPTVHEFHLMILESVESRPDKPVKIYCDDCGSIWLVSPENYLVGAHKCARCYERMPEMR